MDDNYVLSSSVFNGQDGVWHAQADQSYPEDEQDGPYYGDEPQEPVSVYRYRTGTGPWNATMMATNQDQTRTGYHYVPASFVTESPRSQEANPGSAEEDLPTKQDHKEEKGSKKKQKSQKAMVKKDTKDKNEGKHPDSKKNKNHKGHKRHGHGSWRPAV